MTNDAASQTKLCPFCAEEIKSAAVVCKHCGREIGAADRKAAKPDHEFKLGRCIRCGTSSTNAMTYKTQCKPVQLGIDSTTPLPVNPVVPPSVSGTQVSSGAESTASAAEDLVRCPKCRSTKITAQKQGFGLGKAVIGGVLTGGVGLLAGFLGSGNVKVTCLQCGHAFRPGG